MQLGQSSAAKLNFSALQGLRSPDNMVGTILAVGFIAFFLSIPIAILVQTESAWGWLMLVAVVVGLVLFLIQFIKKNKQLQREYDAKMSQFAQDNHFKYLHGGVTVGPGTLFTVGGSKVSRGSFAGTLEALPFCVYSYQYETGGGKNRTTHDAMVMELTLPRVLPQFVIDSEIERVLPISFDKSQKIELEGDFHKYFDFYAPDKYGVTALTLLAPDVMDVLLERAALCDIEIVQNRLYFYWPVPARTAEQFQDIFETAQAVIKKLGTKLTKDDIYGTKSQAAVNAAPNSSGVRLKRSGIGIVTVVLVVGYFVAELFNGLIGPIGGLFVAVFWIGFIVYALGTLVKQGRLRKKYMSRYKRKVV